MKFRVDGNSSGAPITLIDTQSELCYISKIGNGKKKEVIHGVLSVENPSFSLKPNLLSF